MTTLVVLPAMLQDSQLDKMWDDFMEAIQYENRTQFCTRVALDYWHKNGLPYYTPLPQDELTYIEGRML